MRDLRASHLLRPPHLASPAERGVDPSTTAPILLIALITRLLLQVSFPIIKKNFPFSEPLFGIMWSCLE